MISLIEIADLEVGNIKATLSIHEHTASDPEQLDRPSPTSNRTETKMTANTPQLPLAGLRVVEIAQNIAGPYAGEILSLLGAEVIKIERPGTGDDARGWGPPFWRGVATTFVAMNHGKKSISLDLKSKEHREWLNEFVQDCDVLIQNMRPGLLEEIGFGAEQLCKANPRLIYCSLTAFGHKGPKRLDPGYEPMVQAYSGIFSINGAEDGPSARVGMQVLDMGTGIWGALGCLAALNQRNSTGKGCVVDGSLFETSMSWMQTMLAGFMVNGKQPERHRSGNPNVVVFQALPTSDGEVVVAAANDRLFDKLAKLVGHPEWMADARYASNALRVENKHSLLEPLEKIFKTRSSAEWLELLEAAGIPAAPIHDIAQVMKEPHTAAIEIFQTIPEMEIDLVGLPLSFDRRRPPPGKRAPNLGEHNQEFDASGKLQPSTAH